MFDVFLILTFLFVCFLLFGLLAILRNNQTGSSFRDESMHSTVTQKQSIDSMTLSHEQSFKMHSSNQYRLKSNFRRNSSVLIECQQSKADVSTSQIEDVANKDGGIAAKKNRIIKSEYVVYGPELNSNAFRVLKTESIPINENQIESAEMLSMEPRQMEANANITGANARQSYMRRIKTMYFRKLTRSTAQPNMRSWFGWFRAKRNSTFYSPPSDHPPKAIKIQIHINENPSAVCGECTPETAVMVAAVAAAAAVANCVDTTSSNDDEDISNSDLQNVDPMAVKDELAAYMDEIRAREKR